MQKNCIGVREQEREREIPSRHQMSSKFINANKKKHTVRHAGDEAKGQMCYLQTRISRMYHVMCFHQIKIRLVWSGPEEVVVIAKPLENNRTYALLRQNVCVSFLLLLLFSISAAAAFIRNLFGDNVVCIWLTASNNIPFLVTLPSSSWFVLYIIIVVILDWPKGCRLNYTNGLMRNTGTHARRSSTLTRSVCVCASEWKQNTIDINWDGHEDRSLLYFRHELTSLIIIM